jgi:transcriptional regulator with XRE-family HTH domain
MNQKKIGTFLQTLRKEQGLTQEQLAERIGVARRTVSRWETGANLPDLDVLVELSDFYAVDLRELLDGERREQKMDKELEETVLKVAEYSNAGKERIKRVVNAYFVLGILALAVNVAMEVLGLDETFDVGFVKGVSYGIALGAMIMGILYTTGLMERFRAFKMRLLGREVA